MMRTSLAGRAIVGLGLTALLVAGRVGAGIGAGRTGTITGGIAGKAGITAAGNACG